MFKEKIYYTMIIQQLYKRIKRILHKIKFVFGLLRKTPKSEWDDPAWLNGFAIGFKHGQQMGYGKGRESGYIQALKEVRKRAEEERAAGEEVPKAVIEVAYNIPYVVTDEQLYEREKVEGVRITV